MNLAGETRLKYDAQASPSVGAGTDGDRGGTGRRLPGFGRARRAAAGAA